MKKHIYFLISILVLIFFGFHSQNFRIDASSDTLVAQNDKDFIFFNSYNKIFPSKNFLVLAIKSKKEIDNQYINVINNLNKKIKKLDGVDNVFSINDLPILFLNNTTLSNLSNQNIENILNSDYELKKILEEFSNNPIYQNQIINSSKDISSIIIYLKKNTEYLKIKEKNINSPTYETKNKYLQIKNELDQKRSQLISNIRNIINSSDKNYEYFLGGIDMIADDVISFVEKDIVIFSIAVLIFIIIVLFFIFREVKWVLICLLSSCYAVFCMFGLLGFLKLEVTAVSSNFASLMFILSISMNIHIINYHRLNHNPLSLSIYHTFKNMFFDVLN